MGNVPTKAHLIIPGMPHCGLCPTGCGVVMHFASEIQEGVCRFCGKDGQNAVDPNTGLRSSQKALAKETTSQAPHVKMGATVAGTGMHEHAHASPAAAMLLENQSAKAPAEIQEGDGGRASPDIVMAHLKAKGFDPSACPHCTLRESGMDVDVNVVPHTNTCVNNQEG